MCPLSLPDMHTIIHYGAAYGTPTTRTRRQIAWTFWERSRLPKTQPPASGKGEGEEEGPEALLESTRIQRGSIVYIMPNADVDAAHRLDSWLIQR